MHQVLDFRLFCNVRRKEGPVRWVFAVGIRGTFVNKPGKRFHTARRRGRRSGQSVVEFALVLPILVILMLAVVDLARIYTTMLTVESAAREAADFGTFGSQKWDPSVYNVVARRNRGGDVAPSVRRLAHAS